MNIKSYRNWRLSYSARQRRYTARGFDVENNPKEVAADNRADLERKVDKCLAPIPFSTVWVLSTLEIGTSILKLFKRSPRSRGLDNSKT